MIFDETHNLQLFSVMNASDNATPLMISMAKFCANDLLYMTLLFLAVYWVKGALTQRQLVIKTLLSVILALILAFFIGVIDPTSRPFVAGIGHTFLPHAPTPSFPSDHMVIFSVFVSSFYLEKKHLIALILGIAGLLTAWARVYVGVHFPLDMLGGLLLGIVSAQVMTIIWLYWGEQITHPILMGYQMVLGKFLPNVKWLN